MFEEHTVEELISTWLEVTKGRSLRLGISREEALGRAREILPRIRAEGLSPEEIECDENFKNVLYALVNLVSGSSYEIAEERALDATAVGEFIRRAWTASDEFGEKEQLLSDCEEIAKMNSAGSEEPLPVFHRRGHYLSMEEGRTAGERILATPIAERAERAKELHLEEPAAILWILGRLAELRESSPSVVRDEAEFLYWFILKPKRRIGLHDEREYFLGESALLAATACRLLSRREEAYRWLDRAEAGFKLTSTHVEDLCRLAYQRLALYVEERRFEEVLELAPELFETMVARSMSEDAAKTLVLQALALHETGKLAEAVEAYNRLYERTASLPNGEYLRAVTHVNLGQVYAALGEPDKALEKARQAAEIFLHLNNPHGLAKLHWTIGDALRTKHLVPDAIQAYREAQERFRELQMRADVASLHLVIADLLLDLGQDRQAECEIRAALPVLIEEKIVPEGIAALSLLEQSLKARRIDRQALRDLRGHFGRGRQPSL